MHAAGVHGAAVAAGRTTIRAGLAALDARPGEALALYREALDAWKELGLLWDEAMTGLDMVLLLDPSEPEVAAAGATARDIFTQLEAAPFIERLDRATAQSRPSALAAPEGSDVSGEETRSEEHARPSGG